MPNAKVGVSRRDSIVLGSVSRQIFFSIIILLANFHNYD